MDIKNFFTPGNNKVPTPVVNRLKAGLGIGIAVLVFGAATSILVRSAFPLFAGLLLATILGLFGYSTYLDVSKNGYDVLEGEVVMLKYGHVPKMKLNNGLKLAPKSFIIRDLYNIQYQIPVSANRPIQVGENVRVYVNKKSRYYEIDGITHITEVLAYEVFYGGKDGREN